LARSLSKEASGSTSILGWSWWDPRGLLTAQNFDLDAFLSCCICGERQGAFRRGFHFSTEIGLGLAGAVEGHLGDNRTGEGEVSDEAIQDRLSKNPGGCKKVVFVRDDHEPKRKSQKLGQVAMRLWHSQSERSALKLSKYDLFRRLLQTETRPIDPFGEIYGHNEGGKMKAIGAGLCGRPRAIGHGTTA